MIIDVTKHLNNTIINLGVFPSETHSGGAVQ